MSHADFDVVTGPSTPQRPVPAPQQPSGGPVGTPAFPPVTRGSVRFTPGQLGGAGEVGRKSPAR
jgi:hypothetical protein